MASEDSAGARYGSDERLSGVVTILGLLSVAAGAVRPDVGLTAARVLVALAFVAVVRHRVSNHGPPTWSDVTDPWVLCWVAGASLTIALPAPGATPGGLASAGLLASFLTAFGVGFTVWDRLRSAAVHLLAETAIATGGAGLVVWVLFLEGRLAGLDTPGQHALTIAFVASALGVAATRVAIALVSGAVGGELTSVRLLGLAILSVTASTLVTLAVTLGVDVPGVTRTVVAIGTLTFATAGLLHPSNDLLLAPAVVQHLRIDLRRTATVLAGVLVGPSLVAVALVTDREISVPTAVGGGAVLCLAISVYVLRMVRRWGVLEHEVSHDALTGLPNRSLFEQRLDLAIARSRRDRRTIAVMFLDLDRFKNVNDSLGHEAGNELLCAVADRLTDVIQGDATVARLGGDEFAIILPKIASLRQSEAVARQVLQRFAQPFQLGRRRLYVTPSIGVAHFPQDARDAAALLEAADSAMYRAKEGGRNTVALYTEAERSGAVARLDIESALHDAMQGNQLVLRYQPKLDIRSGEIAGVEALLRWHHPGLGFIPPDEFIPVAEESGLIEHIGEWVLTEACAQTVRWARAGLPPVVVAVNLSPRQFQLSQVPDMVARTLRSTGLPARYLELEITENLALQDPEAVQRSLEDLRSIGVRFAIDDFGVGYSGLEYLERFRFDAIKIDRTFVRRIDESGGPIVKAVIAMAKGLGLEVIAEGVETRSQLDFLRRHGCDQMQGFLLSRPVAPEEIETMLRKSLERRQQRAQAPPAHLPVPVNAGAAGRPPTDDPPGVPASAPAPLATRPPHAG
jgi:diguanylate cyclase (GGDEF)-like protein